jgi:hypothetical protein
MGDIINACKILVFENVMGKGFLTRCRWEDIKVDLGEIGCESVD